MFLPLYDQAGFRHIKRPLGVYLIIGANILVFALTSALSALRPELSFGMIPAVVFGTAILPDSVLQTPAFVTPFTSVFLHGGFEHIIGNMLFLWVFGDNVEDAMGTPRFILFYLLCGWCAAMAHAIAMPHSHAPLIGASGAVSGVIAAYVLLHPHVRVYGLAMKWIPVAVKAMYVIAAWIVLQFVFAIFGGDPNVGWWAHVGGIIAGAMLVVFFKRRGVALLDRRLN